MLWFHKRCRSFRHLLDVYNGHDNVRVSQMVSFFQASTWRVSWAWQCYGFTNVVVLSGIYLTCVMGMTMLWFHKCCRSFRHVIDLYHGHDNVIVSQRLTFFQASIWRVSWAWQCYGFTNVDVLSGIYLTCIMGMTMLWFHKRWRFSGIYLTCIMGMTMLWFHKGWRSFRHLLDVYHVHDNVMVSQTLSFFQASTWRVSWAWQCCGYTNVVVLSGIYLTCVMGMTMLGFHKRCRSFRHLLDVCHGHDNAMVSQTLTFFQASTWRVSCACQCYGFTNVVVLSGIYLTCVMGMTMLGIHKRCRSFRHLLDV